MWEKQFKFLVTLVIKVSCSVFKLSEMLNLDLKREGAGTVYEPRLVWSQNGCASGREICTLLVTGSYWIQVCTQIWYPQIISFMIYKS